MAAAREPDKEALTQE